MIDQKQIETKDEEKEDVITHLLKEMSNYEIFMDWIGEDPTCFVNARREMRFLKCKNGMISYKMTIEFKKGDDMDKEMASLIQVAINKSSDSIKEHIYNSTPVSIRRYLTV